jgi:transcriptional regulator with XRE-family HTH domain
MFEPDEREAARMGLAEALRTLRRATGLSGERLADRTGISQSKISKIETGKLTPSLADVERIVHALAVDRDYATELLELARAGSMEYESHRAAQRRGWSNVQRELAAVEGTATELRYMLPMMITGLLQTREYASAAVGRALYDKSRTEIVDRKLDRQRVLHNVGKQFLFLMTETALRWRLVEPAAMAAQLDKVVAAADLPTVSVQVIPLAKTVPTCPLEVFTVYDSRLVTIETSSGGIALRDPQDISYYRTEFDFLSRHALIGAEARDFVRGIAEEFRNEARAFE